MRPPFRVEHVGSFLRPERLIQAARDRKAGKIGDAEVKRLQDECVREVGGFPQSDGLRGRVDCGGSSGGGEEIADSLNRRRPGRRSRACRSRGST